MTPSRRRPREAPTVLADGDRTWYRDAIIYELHVRAFCDSNGDGIGDFPGLASRLDYLRDLGVTALWLLPFYPSPLRDDGYDIADYTGVHPAYGTLADFKTFLREAHKRNLRVITELVVNHTSDQHPWFRRARRAPAGSPYRDFYVWSDTPDRYADARIIFKDFETSNWTWDGEAGAYYWHRFYAHQPDLNFRNPEVRKALYKVMDFWLGLGVDGLRLDAVPYLHEREGTGCENLSETHDELKALRRHVDENHRARMLLAEANQWPEDAVAYFGNGDECHMAFHFPLMPRMFMAARMEDRYPIVDILNQTPAIPEGCQWGLFLRNHDELTLEMVTDEERDYMYRVYATDPQARINLGIRRRLAPLLGGDRRRIELMNGLLFSLPGTPVVYYGDEIGMGDNVYLGDRNGVRTPMQWSPDRNAGFSRANPQRLFLPVVIDPPYSFDAVNVESQHDNPHSLLWWMRRLIALRKRFRAFGRGELTLLHPVNHRVLAFLRTFEEERILVVANLSRFAQAVELDLRDLAGMVPVETFGRIDFPAVGELPYLLTLGPHGFYYFSLERRPAAEGAETEGAPPPLSRIAVSGGWESLFGEEGRRALEGALPRILPGRRWFGGKARRIKGASIEDVVAVPLDGETVRLVVAGVEYAEGDPETYVLLLAVATGDRAAAIRENLPHAVLASVRAKGGEGILFDAAWDDAFARSLLVSLSRRKRFKGEAGEVAAIPSRAFRRIVGNDPGSLAPAPLSAEQSNTSIRFGEGAILKIFRRLEDGVNPDLEISSYLTGIAGFTHVPPVAGHLEYRRGSGGTATLGILQGFVRNERDAWLFTLDAVARYFDRVLARPPGEIPPPAGGSLTDLAAAPVPVAAHEIIGTYLEAAHLLGRRTAELHLVLAANVEDPGFRPEPFTPFYQRSLYQSVRNLTEQTFELLRRRLAGLSPDVAAEVDALLPRKDEALGRAREILDGKLTALRTRLHGDLHLGQALWTGRDFVIFDFEGEPARTLSARRIKRSPLRDTAGMIRSFHYAAHQGLETLAAGGMIRAERIPELEAWAASWYRWVSASYLGAYLETASGGSFLPRRPEEIHGLLTLYLMEKTLYELTYELNNRPGWIRLPLRGIVQLLDAP